MQIISIGEHPEYTGRAIEYFQKHWASPESMMVYQDCITHTGQGNTPLPQWYLLMEKEEIIGGAGLISNDFISRMDLSPWLCALFIEENYRWLHYGELLVERVGKDAQKYGFAYLYLCTDHVGYYENRDLPILATDTIPGEDNQEYTDQESYNAADPAHVIISRIIPYVTSRLAKQTT